MGAQASEPPRLGVEQERNRIGGEPLRPSIDDQAERPAADQIVQGGEIVLAMERRFVHRRPRRAGLEQPASACALVAQGAPARHPRAHQLVDEAVVVAPALEIVERDGAIVEIAVGADFLQRRRRLRRGDAQTAERGEQARRRLRAVEKRQQPRQHAAPPDLRADLGLLDDDGVADVARPFRRRANR